ncbi:MAG: clan AA aspartic protease, partial [Pseudomonadales bacterium]|nr:clan AA aspartic protease [Pseudomonadales bacterium]
VIVTVADLHRRRGADQASLDALLQAALLVEDEGQDMKLSLALEDLTDDWSRELIAREDFDSVDRMYQSITLAMPERAEYFLKLGRLRMRMGDFERALVPLSHIENHRTWGASAREMIAQAEASEIRESPGQERLALRSAGSQFVVEATLDHGRTIHLLVDTGAAMTIIDEALLSGSGYALANRRQEYFATAGGVVTAPVLTVGHLALGNAGISELPVGALPLGIDGIDGLLGMNFLRHYEFRIDQGEQVLYLDSHH